MTKPALKKRKIFPGESPAAARDAASKWLRNFDIHGPLDITSISVSEDEDRFIATVIFTNASIETTPRYFAEKPAAEPQPAAERTAA